MSSKIAKYFFPFVLLILAIFTRFYKLDWGSGYYFHPDENNMASAILQMNWQNLNPHFFAYGQFPLYLTFLTTPKHDLSTIISTLRFWSATFSTISIYIFYLIGLTIFKSKKNSLIFILLIIFTPGLIQLSHFGTTESILTFIFAVNLLLSLQIFSKFKKTHLLLAGFFSGIGLATKISAAIFLLPIFLSLFFVFQKNKNLSSFLIRFSLFSFLSLLFFFIFSPYNWLDFNSFRSSISYEINVATGRELVFYTRQFSNTIPYFFQFQKIFPYTNGLPILFFSLIGLIFTIKSYISKHKSKTALSLVLIPVLIFFLYQGQLFTKWTRFMSPIFFIFPFLSIYFFQKIKSKLILLTLVLISIFPGICFLNIYFHPDVRLSASNWINQNIPQKSQILSESGNVVNLPLKQSNLSVTNFNFYDLDQDYSQQIELNNLVRNSNYIFIPSRRVFKNQNNSSYPYSQKYYQNLFSNSFGFYPQKSFSVTSSLFLNPENAEETWSVFDHPIVRIFAKK